MVELHRTEVDNVAAIWTEAPPPLQAGLFFRTGQVDETLATAGQTHLIEHLVLSSFSGVTPSHGGFVGGVLTGFVKVGGNPEEIISFFASVCEALTSLPGERLEEEKQILAAEISARPYDLRSTLLTWRYRATGYGLIGLPQHGIQKATLTELREYCAQRFTKENAVLWLSGPPPADLVFRLPHGTKQPLPPLVPIHKTFPSWYWDNACMGVAVGATVPRISESTLFIKIATDRLHKRLRTDEAVSYAPRVLYDQLNADTAHLVLYADSDHKRRKELANAFGEIFKELGEIKESEVDAARRQILEYMTGPLIPPIEARMVAEVQRAAWDWILSREFQSVETNAQELYSVSADEVSAFGREMQAVAMFALPSNADLKPWFGLEAQSSTGPVVRGREVRSVDAPIQKLRLVYGPDGVSILFPNGTHNTVRYSDLAAALYYKDGCLALWGLDATTVTVEPTLWHNGQSICREILERVPAHLVLEQPARPTNVIPRRKTTAWQRFWRLFTKN